MKKLTSALLAIAFLISFNPVYSAHSMRDLLFEQDVPPGFKGAQKLELTKNSDGDFLSEQIDSFINEEGDVDSFKFISPKRKLTLIIETENPEFFTIFNKNRKPQKSTTDSDNNLIVPLGRRGRYTVTIGRKNIMAGAYSFKLRLTKSLDLKTDTLSCPPDDEVTNDDLDTDDTDDNSANDPVTDDGTGLSEITEGIKNIEFNQVESFIYGGRDLQNLDFDDDRVFGYRFSVSEDNEGFYTIETVLNAFDLPLEEKSFPTSSHTEISLFDNSGNKIASSTGVQASHISALQKINRFLSQGTYTVKVKKSLKFTAGIVRLFVRPQDDHGNGVNTASNLVGLTGGRIEVPGDTDYFKIGKLIPGAKYNIRFRGDLSTGFSIFYQDGANSKRFVLSTLPNHFGEFVDESNFKINVPDSIDPDSTWYIRVGNASFRNANRKGDYTMLFTQE